MGLVNWFICNVENPDTVLARDLTTMAIADGEFTKQERDELLRICQEEGITYSELFDALRGEHLDITPRIPQTAEEKTRYIRYLINMMEVDDYCSPLEVHTLVCIANRIGISNMKIISLLTEKLKDGQVEQRKEFRILESFIESYIAIEND